MRNVGTLVLVLIMAFLVSCTPPEHDVLNTFISASQAGNEDAVAAVSLAKFPSEVSSWELVELGPESTSPFGLAGFYEELDSLKEELEDKILENDAFLQENKAVYLDYKQKFDQDPEQEFKGKLGEFHVVWSVRLKAQTDLDRAFRDKGDDIDALKKEASLSINTPGMSSRYEGDVKEKEAHLKVDGKGFTVTLKRYSLINTENKIEPMSRWIITDIQEAS